MAVLRRRSPAATPVRRMTGGPALLAVTMAIVVGAAEAEDAPLRATRVFEFDDRRIPVPLEIYLTPAGATRVDVKVAGNLRALQQALPGILTQVVEDTCERRIGLEVGEIRSEGDQVRGRGRVQVIAYRCRDVADFDTRRLRFSNTAEVDLLLDGRIVDDCVAATLLQLEIDPGGFVGTVLNLTGISRKVAEKVRAGLNQKLNSTENCLDLPEILQTLDAAISSGGFRDFGDGAMGFVVEGTLEVTAVNTVALVRYLEREGRLGD